MSKPVVDETRVVGECYVRGLVSGLVAVACERASKEGRKSVLRRTRTGGMEITEAVNVGCSHGN